MNICVCVCVCECVCVCVCVCVFVREIGKLVGSISSFIKKSLNI